MPLDGSSSPTGGRTLDRYERPETVTPDRRHSRSDARWLWLIVAIAAGAAKTEAYSELLHHRVWALVLLAALVARCLLRARPVTLAVSAAALFAVAMRPHSFARGLVLGAGAFGVLLGLLLVLTLVVELRARASS